MSHDFDERLIIKIERLRAQNAEVADFLDRLAAQMERWTRPPGAGEAAADCRAQARKLRGET